jgi:hypothetical protein
MAIWSYNSGFISSAAYCQKVYTDDSFLCVHLLAFGLLLAIACGPNYNLFVERGKENVKNSENGH